MLHCQNCGKAGLAVFQATTPGRPTLMVYVDLFEDVEVPNDEVPCVEVPNDEVPNVEVPFVEVPCVEEPVQALHDQVPDQEPNIIVPVEVPDVNVQNVNENVGLRKSQRARKAKVYGCCNRATCDNISNGISEHPKNVKEAMKSKDKPKWKEAMDCLLYTSPSPRD